MKTVAFGDEESFDAEAAEARSEEFLSFLEKQVGEGQKALEDAQSKKEKLDETLGNCKSRRGPMKRF